MGAASASPAARQDRGDPLSADPLVPPDDAGPTDPFLRWQIRTETVRRRWDSPEGTAVLQEGRRGIPVLTVVGAPSLALEVVPEALAQEDVRRVTLPRGAVELLHRHGAGRRIGRGDDWDWFWTDAPPPPVPGEDDVRPLHDVDDEVRALLAAASPRHSAVPGARGIERWVGVRDGDGRLVAVAANEPMRPDVPHLASIATHPRVRGTGLGAAATAALTRALLAEGNPVVTLGMYADNHVARRMYLRLGYRCAHQFSSRAVLGERPLTG